MVYKDPYMLELDAFSEGKHFMDMTHLPRRSPLAKPATVGQNGAAYVAALERNPSTGKHQSRYMHLKILKRE